MLPTIGVSRAAAIAPRLGVTVGYDLDEALEEPEVPGPEGRQVPH